jgi:hypothetical protein
MNWSKRFVGIALAHGLLVWYRESVISMIEFSTNPSIMRPKMRFAGGCGWALLAVCVFLFASVQVQGAVQGTVIQANSMANADVIAAVAQAHDGDTVIVPAGIAQWTKNVTVSNAITLQFAGVGQSIVQDYIVCPQPNNTPGWAEGVVTFFTTSNKIYRLSGLEVDAGLVRSQANNFVHGAVEIMGTTTGFRVDHCAFNNLNDDAVYAYNASCGVIDHCTFYNLLGDASHAVCVFHDVWANQTFGDGSWDTPVEWGTTNAVYVEDCAFTNTIDPSWACLDSFGGAHWVFRHNTVYNGYVCNHGTESTGIDRGTRSEEVYLNTFIHTSNFTTVVCFRSGTGVIWSNTATGFYNMATVNNYRCSDYFPYWGAADGTNALDSNANAGTPVLTVTHTGPNNSTALVVSNANWTTNQWVGFSVIDTNILGTTNFGLINSNSANTVYLVIPQISPRTMFNTGDTVQFFQISQALDMPGTGLSAPLNRAPKTSYPLPPWPSQAIEPIYCWGNSLNGSVGTIGSAYPIITEGTYFFDGVAKPGYTPLTYPHPLVLIGTNSITVPTETPPAAPTNLRIATSP